MEPRKSVIVIQLVIDNYAIFWHSCDKTSIDVLRNIITFAPLFAFSPPNCFGVKTNTLSCGFLSTNFNLGKRCDGSGHKLKAVIVGIFCKFDGVREGTLYFPVPTFFRHLGFLQRYTFGIISLSDYATGQPTCNSNTRNSIQTKSICFIFSDEQKNTL